MTPLQQAELHFKAGNFAAACEELSSIKKGSVEKDLLLARCAIKLGNGGLAALSLGNVLAREPGHAFAVSTLAALYVNAGQHAKAADIYRKALKTAADEKLRCEYGVVLWMQGRRDEGFAEVNKAVLQKPDFNAARMQRATMFMARGEKEKAVEDLRILVEREPGNGAYLKALGMMEFGLARYPQAVAALQQASARLPADAPLVRSLAIAQTMTGQIEESYLTLSRLKAMDLKLWQDTVSSSGIGNQSGQQEDFDPRPLFLSVVFQEQQQCDWSRRGKYEEVFRQIIAQPGSMDIGPVTHYAGVMDLGNAERLSAMKSAGAAASRGATPYQHAAATPPGKLRIAYLLPHVGRHVVASIVREMIAVHDREAFEVHVFSTRQLPEDYASGVPEHFQAIPGLHYEDLTPMTDAEAAARIHEKGISVVVDLAIYNDNGRPGIMARRPAPVQVNYLGAPFTSGGDWMDYIITDDIVAPQDTWCSEAEVRMPACYFVFGHEDETPPAAPPRQDFGLPEQDFLFSALNNSYKIDAESFASWMRILRETAGSKLLLKDGKGIPENLRREAQAHGVDPERLVFVPKVASDRDYLLRQGTPDLFLDTRIYGAHTTMAESLWMGVPGISCPGISFQSRVGSSLLASCDLHGLIVPDWQAYENLAISLFHDRPRLQALRARLAQNRLRAAPYDIKGQARALEKAYRHMVAQHAAGKPCTSFKVAEL